MTLSVCLEIDFREVMHQDTICEKVRKHSIASYCNLAYSSSDSFRMGMPGSISLHRVIVAPREKIQENSIRPF
jgi:hypothetical protein